jgi:hypothetical protein
MIAGAGSLCGQHAFLRIPGHVNNHSGDVNNGFRADVNNGFRGQVNEKLALPGIFIHIPELIS